MTRKVKISFLILVWSIVAVQIYVNSQIDTKREQDVVTAFSVMNQELVGQNVKGYGHFGTMNISQETKKKMLENLALKLGITDDYSFAEKTGENYQKVELVKNGKYANTSLQILSMQNTEGESEQYIAMEIQTKEDVESVYQLYKKVKRIYEEIGVDGQVSLEVEMRRAGNEIETNEGELVDELFEMVGAKQVDKIWENDIYTVYGYTDLEDSYLLLNEKKVNMQIVMSYDEAENITYIKVGMPIVNTSY